MSTEKWFGSRFSELHPLLRQLHRSGGTLRGEIDVRYGTGIAGLIGIRLAARLGVPTAGTYEFRVDISYHIEGLHWDRYFGGEGEMKSLFRPIGSIETGYWLEKTGPLDLHLTVDIRDGGWYWRCLRFRLFGIPMPAWLFPKSTAYKKIENGHYRFYVGFSLPILGELLSYSGLLRADTTVD